LTRSRYRKGVAEVELRVARRALEQRVSERRDEIVREHGERGALRATLRIALRLGALALSHVGDSHAVGEGGRQATCGVERVDYLEEERARTLRVFTRRRALYDDEAERRLIAAVRDKQTHELRAELVEQVSGVHERVRGGGRVRDMRQRVRSSRSHAAATKRKVKAEGSGPRRARRAASESTCSAIASSTFATPSCKNSSATHRVVNRCTCALGLL